MNIFKRDFIKVYYGGVSMDEIIKKYGPKVIGLAGILLVGIGNLMRDRADDAELDQVIDEKIQKVLKEKEII
jgi:hypothetical protein